MPIIHRRQTPNSQILLSAMAAAAAICINEVLTDDELRSILSRFDSDKDKEVFGLVCKRWLHLQSSERRKLSARAGPHMLSRIAARFSRLVELDLSQSVSRSFYPGVTDSDLAVVAASFTGLKVLNLSNCKGITDAGMREIGGSLSSLQSLDVSYCRKLTDHGLEAVAEGCPDLKKLYLEGCRFVTDKLLLAISCNCRNLKELGMQGCNNVTDQGISDLVDGCRKVELLDINKCSNVGDLGVSRVAECCFLSLRTLKLLDCSRVGDLSILSLANHCKNLETLIIGGCRDVSDEPLKCLAVACGDSLKYLRMDWCLNVTDSSLMCILSRCRHLEALDIGCCEAVTDAAFEVLGSDGLQLRLKFLKVGNCPSVTVRAIGLILAKCSSLKYLDVRSCPRISKSACDEAGLQFPESCKVNFCGSLSEPDVIL